MKIIGTTDVFTQSEIDLIIAHALRILEEVGCRIPNDKVLTMLAEHGTRVDFEHEMAYFPRPLIEQFIADSEPAPITSARTPSGEEDCLHFEAGAYPQFYADPRSGNIREHTQQTIIEMTHLVDKLDNITGIYCGMGVPSDVPPRLVPLYQRLSMWKYTQKGWSGKVEISELLPYIQEMCQIYADSRGRPISDFMVFDFQMISPLQFGREELQQFIYFWERGFPASCGQILSMGGTSPATLAANISLQLAEQLIINLIGRTFYGLKHLRMGNSITVMDMKTGVFQYGRPELGLTHLAFGQIARYFKASFHANSFLADAKVPSVEAGMQKALNVIPAILAGSRQLGTVGLLSVDEIGSPIQLILDSEYARALQRFAAGFEVNEETLAFDLIKSIGPGGNYLAEMHTAKNYRKEHWQPKLFSREMYNGWINGDHKTDVERALDVYEKIMSQQPTIYIPEEIESALLTVIEAAACNVA
jgi:trimethylamine---corrinoid protein Co-methyltransferase